MRVHHDEVHSEVLADTHDNTGTLEVLQELTWPKGF
jgi:hypothetical protein